MSKIVSSLFDERKAITKRLSQIDQTELRVLKELKAEREDLLTRLQELENKTGKSIREPLKNRRTREHVHVLRETAVAYLKERKEPVRAVEIQKFVERETSRKITNMSTFMRALEPEYERVRRLGRGLYIYEYGSK